MNTLEIKVPAVAYIIVAGPTQCGKSIVMDRIEKLLKAEFGALVVSEDLQTERNNADYDNLEDWQNAIVSNTVWVLSETNNL